MHMVTLEQPHKKGDTHENRDSHMAEKGIEATRLKVSVGYWSLDDLEKAVKMCCEKGISMRVAAKVCNIKKRAIERAKIAIKEGRNIGITGRPRLLTPKYEAELVKEIDEAEKIQKHLTMEEAKTKVCVSFSFSSHSLHSISYTLSPIRLWIYIRASHIKISLRRNLHSLHLISGECLKRINLKKDLGFLLNKYASSHSLFHSKLFLR